MAADLRQRGRSFLGEVEGVRPEDAANTTKVHGREKIFEIDSKDPALPTVDCGVRLWAAAACKTVDVRPWRVGAVEHRQQRTLEVLDRLDRGADDARSATRAPGDLKLVVALVLIVGPDPPGQKTQRCSDVPGHVGTGQEDRDVGRWLQRRRIYLLLLLPATEVLRARAAGKSERFDSPSESPGKERRQRCSLRRFYISVLGARTEMSRPTRRSRASLLRAHQRE